MIRMTDTREQIMDRAAQLLMSRGFNGFSYSDISSHLGVKNAAVHYHFPAKADLAVALVDEYRQLLRSRTSEFMAYGGSAAQQLQGFFKITTRQCNTGRSICPLGAFSIDFNELPEEVRQVIASFMDETIKWLTQVLEVGREQNEFRFSGEAKPKALNILASLQGARQMARVNGIELLDAVVKQIHQDLDISS